MSTNTGYTGFQDTSTATGGAFNARAFLVKQILGRVNTATLVQIQAVTNNGGVSPVGFVDALPLVNQIDGAGNATPHGTIHNLPYFRLQGGGNAVILDPQVGDIGIAIFASRDISSVKVNKGRANPGSRRQYDMADGLYIGGVLNGTPTQYVQFSSGGMSLVSPTKITLQAPDIEFDGPTHTTGAVTGDSTATYQGEGTFAGSHTVSQHTHTDPQGGSTGTPTG